MGSRVYPIDDDLYLPVKLIETKLNQSFSQLDFKSKNKLKRAKSAENLPLRDRNAIDLK